MIQKWKNVFEGINEEWKAAKDCFDMISFLTKPSVIQKDQFKEKPLKEERPIRQAPQPPQPWVAPNEHLGIEIAAPGQ